MNLSFSIKHLLAGAAVALAFSACSSSRKTVSRPAPPPTATTNKPAPEKKPEPKADKKIPFNVPAFAKDVKRASYNVAIFAPLYLDSAFAGSNDIAGRTMPRYVLPGLEFYEGAQLALDSLQSQGYNLRVTVYDSKGKQSVSNLIHSKVLDATDLIIGSVTNPDLKELSDFSRDKNINFISATYPNDGGVTDNPFLFISNSTLKTHCEAIQKYVQESFSSKNIVLLRRNTAFENRMAADFKTAYEKMDNPKKSRIREVIWQEGTTPEELSKYLLTDRTNIVIVTALDENGAKTLLRKLNTNAATYPMQIYGMPTWDVFRFKEPEFKGMQIYYSSPYFNDKNDPYSRYVTDYFRKTYRARPSDMAFKGFDMTYYFVRQLRQNGVYFNAEVNESPKIISQYNFQPVYIKEGEQTPSYFENKNIYIIQKGENEDIKMNTRN
ncbi:ABC-type branched-subunit amino acid transport system substrate-binding protein [Chitinophaga dinghuensis]|uniref:ABC-type branched-subunit amino acid transport system substrate-binding protein n=1 Tax=Chitinophaga dinghuensis TaxID=1539050 RepID=A0A327WAL2_9BACT|nr:ABC transporter substrate-binding protein [Chitinophaga dinghuensis]RAJ83088.1 ABC-type branched-subunit amino acid transport system substrate-binding protein [Chitinophaga dinghuensis]